MSATSADEVPKNAMEDKTDTQSRHKLDREKTDRKWYVKRAMNRRAIFVYVCIWSSLNRADRNYNKQ